MKTVKLIENVYIRILKLPSHEEIKKLGISARIEIPMKRYKSSYATMQIANHKCRLRCSTREVAFLHGHLMYHHRNNFDGDTDKFFRMIIGKHGKDLLPIGMACNNKPVKMK